MLPGATHPLVVDVQVVALDMVKEGSGIGCEKERHGRGTVIRPQVDVQQLATTNCVGDVGMGGVVR